MQIIQIVPSPSALPAAMPHDRGQQVPGRAQPLHTQGQRAERGYFVLKDFLPKKNTSLHVVLTGKTLPASSSWVIVPLLGSVCPRLQVLSIISRGCAVLRGPFVPFGQAASFTTSGSLCTLLLCGVSSLKRTQNKGE